MENLPDSRKQMILKAHERMQEFLNNDNLAMAAPFQHVEKTIKILEVIQASEKKSPTEGTVNIQINNVMNSPESRSRILDGLSKALRAETLNEEISGESYDQTVRDVTPLKVLKAI